MTSKDLAYYKKLFAHLNVNKMGGQVAPHKPLLLLAIMDLVECEVIMLPQIELGEALIAAFKWNWVRYFSKETRFKPIIGTPFYHMSGEPFWRLVPKDPSYAPNTTNITTLREHYEYAEIDSELFILMLDADARQRLRGRGFRQLDQCLRPPRSRRVRCQVAHPRHARRQAPPDHRPGGRRPPCRLPRRGVVAAVRLDRRHSRFASPVISGLTGSLIINHLRNNLRNFFRRLFCSSLIINTA